jgi:hypothetical protein
VRRQRGMHRRSAPRARSPGVAARPGTQQGYVGKRRVGVGAEQRARTGMSGGGDTAGSAARCGRERRSKAALERRRRRPRRVRSGLGERGSSGAAARSTVRHAPSCHLGLAAHPGGPQLRIHASVVRQRAPRKDSP